MRYMNSPTVFNLGGDYVGVQYIESDGTGKNTNNKGNSLQHVQVLQVSQAGWQMKSQKTDIGPYHTHAGMCGAAFGVEGEESVHLGMFQAPITGAGQPALQYALYDNITKTIEVDTNYKYWTVGWYADSGMLANIYGQNPNDQGRDFLRCTGDIPNPGYQQQGGFKPSVKTFVATPHAGRVYLDEEKNSMWFSLVPGVTEKVVPPEPPADPVEPPPADDINEDVTPEVEPPAPENLPGAPMLSGAESGCSVAPSSGSSGLGALVVLGLAAFGLARRRREV
jgi:MYXO-CTERM domain-containing protein